MLCISKHFTALYNRRKLAYYYDLVTANAIKCMSQQKTLNVTCRKYYWSVCGCTHGGRETFHISDEGLSWGNHAHVDLRYQTTPAAASHTDIH